MKVRKAKINDFGKIMNFYKILDKDFVPQISKWKNIKKRTLYRLKSKNSNYFLIEKKVVVGLCGYIKMNKNTTYVTFLGIDPKYRGKGIGFKLRKYMINYMKKEGIEVVKSRTWSQNKKMLHINKKMGFNVDKIIKNDRGPGIDTIWFKKILK